MTAPIVHRLRETASALPLMAWVLDNEWIARRVLM